MHDLDSRVHRLLKAWLAFILKVVQLSHNGVESITMEDISRTIRCGKKVWIKSFQADNVLFTYASTV